MANMVMISGGFAIRTCRAGPFSVAVSLRHPNGTVLRQKIVSKESLIRIAQQCLLNTEASMSASISSGMGIYLLAGEDVAFAYCLLEEFQECECADYYPTVFSGEA